MRQYAELIRKMGFSEILCKCISSQIPYPIETISTPVWLGFPPGFIPIYLDISSGLYYGIWYHFFSNKPYSFVQLSVEDAHRITEISRNEEQLFNYLVIKAIVLDDEITPMVRVFADSLGLQNLSELDKFTMEQGDDVSEIYKLDAFSYNTPLFFGENMDEYDGYFPTLDYKTTELWSSFEISDSIWANWPESLPKPIWLSGDSLKNLFYSYLETGDLSGAWQCLNSTGWRYVEAIDAIKKLSLCSKNNYFSLLSETWVEFAEKTPLWIY